MSPEPTEKTSSPRYWLTTGEKPEGPFPSGYVTEWLRTGQVGVKTLACQVGGQEWKPLDEIPSFASAVPPQTTAPPISCSPPLMQTVLTMETLNGYTDALKNTINRERYGLALTSLLCGIAGLLVWIPLGIAGLIVGVCALRRENPAPDRIARKLAAIGGICMGSASVLLGLICSDSTDFAPPTRRQASIERRSTSRPVRFEPEHKLTGQRNYPTGRALNALDRESGALLWLEAMLRADQNLWTARGIHLSSLDEESWTVLVGTETVRVLYEQGLLTEEEAKSELARFMSGG